MTSHARPALAWLLAAALAAPAARGDDAPEPPPAPRVTALVPLAVPQGFDGTLRLRGMRMKDATEVRIACAGSATPSRIDLKEKNDAAAPSGMDAGPLGDSELVVELALPPEFPIGQATVVVAAGNQCAEPVALQVLPRDALAMEAEPNNAFLAAMKLQAPATVTGLIDGQRDVDVFEIAGTAGRPLRIEICASRVASLLDPLLTAYDRHGHQLAVADDQAADTRDTALEVTPAADGPVFVTLQDALDFGSPWHAYRLEISEPSTHDDPRKARTEASVPVGEVVSFADDVWPVLRANCVSCHRPGKLKGGLDLTTFDAIARGGKHGAVLATGGVPDDSPLLEAVSGDEPEMPPEGEPLTAGEVDLLARWIAQGAVDDTPPGGLGTRRPNEPPIYETLPAVSAIAFSPDGTLLAVSGHHEIVVHRGDGGGIIARWLGDSRRIEGLQFTRDGRFLAACGGSPSEFGEIQVWDVANGTLTRSIRAGSDTLYGVSWSDDGSRLAVGGSDSLVRVFEAATGELATTCDNHLDWVFGTAFVHDGSKIVSVSRDRAVKLIDAATGHLIDDAARPREPVLALARHPHEDLVAFTGTEGKVRLHRMAPRGGRLKEGDDKEESAVREFEHMATPLHAVAFSADGERVACGGQNGEVRIFQTDNGQRLATIAPSGGPIFALAFHPDASLLATAGSDGTIRFHDAGNGRQIAEFPGVPMGRSAR